MLDKIKPADRVTFMMNYLYMTIRSNQMLERGQEITLIKELLFASLDSYVILLSSWISKGELSDRSNEFFIKPNPQILTKEKKPKS
jgi:hypothetical protein